MTVTKRKQLAAWVLKLNAAPNPDHVKKNEDGSLYIPISITQTLLDEIFVGQWSFEMLRETFGRTWARGYGIMTAVCPINDVPIVRGGDAAILLSGNIRLDSPRLEAMVLLSCARKFGRVMGRDINRDKDDAPLPVIQVSDMDAKLDTIAQAQTEMEWKQLQSDLEKISFREDAQAFLDSTSFKYTLEAKKIVSLKPLKDIVNAPGKFDLEGNYTN